MDSHLVVLHTAMRVIDEGIDRFSDLVDHCLRETSLAEVAGEEGMSPEDYLILLLEQSGRVRVLDDDNRVARMDRLRDGLVLAHRLDEEEGRAGLVSAAPDLIGIDADMEPMALEGGGSVSLEFNQDDETRYHEEGSYTGPPGWLDDFEPGDLIAFRRIGEGLQLEPVEEVSDAAEEIAALAVAFDVVSESPGVGVETGEILEQVIIDQPHLFRRPVPPLGELLAAAGLEVVGAWTGPQAGVWKTPAEAMSDANTERVAASFQMDPCCVEALQIAVDYWRKAASVDGVDVLKALRHGGVADAFAEWLMELVPLDSPLLGEFFEELIEGGRSRAAPAHYLYALHLDAAGDGVGAEAELENAVGLDPEFTPALWMLGGYASDRGDARRAVSLLQRSGVDAEDPDLVFHRSLLADTPDVGRNDPCPCGSGRKYKNCHLNSSALFPPARVQWMWNKLDRYVNAHHRHSRLFDLASSAMPPDFDPEDVIEMASDPFIFDLALFDDGAFDGFLLARSDLLPNDEQEIFEEWSKVALACWEVVETDESDTLVLRDTKTGDHVEVHDRSSVRELVTGQLILTRALSAWDTHWFPRSVLLVDLRMRDSLFRLLDRYPDADSIAAWYGVLFEPPTLENTEGEPLTIAKATLRPTHSWAELESFLDELYVIEAEGVWQDVYELGDDESIIRATLTREGDALSLLTNSGVRLSRVLAELGDEVEVVERSEMPFQLGRSRLSEDDGSTGSNQRFPPEIVEEIVEKMEQRWLGESVPALGGATPREAADDPTRREDLLALLRRFDRMDGGEGMITMRTDSLRRKLGLDES